MGVRGNSKGGDANLLFSQICHENWKKKRMGVGEGGRPSAG